MVLQRKPPKIRQEQNPPRIQICFARQSPGFRPHRFGLSERQEASKAKRASYAPKLKAEAETLNPQAVFQSLLAPQPPKKGSCAAFFLTAWSEFFTFLASLPVQQPSPVMSPVFHRLKSPCHSQLVSHMSALRCLFQWYCKNRQRQAKLKEKSVRSHCK